MICRWSFFLIILTAFLSKAQYTDQINSNRPGASIGAFAVGKNVIQAEAGLAFRSFTHAGYNNSTFKGGVGFLSLRWGFLLETLELTYEGQYLIGTLNSNLYSQTTQYSQSGFLQNFIGIKYLIYDPFKKEKQTNVYSWKANNGFKIRDLIPAVSLTLGSNVSFEQNNPFPYNNVFGNLYRPVLFQNLGIRFDEEPFFHLRGTLATQSHFLGTWVFVTNFTYDRYLSKYPQKSYILTLTHTLDPLWSVYIENQGRFSDLYKNYFFRMGAAYLWSDNIQIEATLGSSLKNTPHQLFLNAGISYRLDFHEDYITAEDVLEKKLKKQQRQDNKTFKKNKKDLKKQEKQLKKTLNKNTKKEKKRNRKAKKS
jgi:hypothetical protein